MQPFAIAPANPPDASSPPTRVFTLRTARKRSKSSLLLFEPAVAGEAGPIESRQEHVGARAMLTSSGRAASGVKSLFSEFALDWAAVVICIIVLAVSDKAAPRVGYIPKLLLNDTGYPVLPNSVPSWSVPVYSLLAPAILLGLHTALLRRPSIEGHHLVLGLATSVLFTAALTNCIKLPVGRLRPDFNGRCWPDGKIAWEQEDALGGYAKCSGEPDSVAEGRKSFPSGHSSWSAAGLCFLMFFLFDRLQVFDGSGHPWRLLVACLPGLAALSVGVSRYTDYWHHSSDVVAGLLIGGVIAWLCYRQQRQRLADVDPVMYGSGSDSGGLFIRAGSLDDTERVPLSTLPV